MREEDLMHGLAGLVFRENPIPMLILDENTNILGINHAFEKLTAYKDFECIGKPISLFESSKNIISLYDVCLRKGKEPKGAYGFEIYIRTKNDTDLLVRKHKQALMHENKYYNICTAEDIMHEKSLLEHYQHLAMHDVLTGLPNRLLLKEHFQMAKYRAIRNKKKMALLLCDVNGFKSYNDHYGHDFGDGILQKVAKELQGMLRNNDIVSRYGGDEFVLILEDISYSGAVAEVVRKIQEVLSVSVKYEGNTFQISMSIGSATFPEDGNDFNALIQIADKSMYEEKNHFYDENGSSRT